jgi:hypothetical protein
LEVLQLANGKIKWDKNSRIECFENWILDKSEYDHKALPCFVMQEGLWLARNKLIFQKKEKSLGQVTHHIRFSYGECWKLPKQKALDSH